VQAIAETSRVDEAKAIRDKAVAVQSYARQRGEKHLFLHATKIRMRAEKRWGELYTPEIKATGNQGTADGRDVSGGIVLTPPENGAELPTLEVMGVTKTQSSKWQKLAAVPEEQFEELVDKVADKASDVATSSPRHTKSEFTGEVEWYTPPDYIELARKVMGAIDLDPASSDKAQVCVQAKSYFTVADDGLTKEWKGAVWLNPPYKQPHIYDFAVKMVKEVQSRRVAPSPTTTTPSYNCRMPRRSCCDGVRAVTPLAALGRCLGVPH
jgi:hypothetical protein